MLTQDFLDNEKLFKPLRNKQEMYFRQFNLSEQNFEKLFKLN